MTQNIRVRFAPSPTGPLHIGGVRTALFNYLFAKKHNGTFILRIEDTDQTRFVEGAEKYIIDSLNWCGITIDEGVNNKGDFGPYKQSERKEIYKQYADELVANGRAYYAFDTAEELEAMRERLKESGSSIQQYNYQTRGEMKNSFTLSSSELDELLANNTPYVIRLNVPQNETVVLNDLVLGEIKFESDQLDDKVLFKSDGMPTYHLANVVDDHLMVISHVIRGSEWVNSTPIHILLYSFLGWELPIFAHMPLILKPSGKGKLSKRDGDALGFPVFPLEWANPETGDVSSGYRESGYFPEAFLNILAFLGWNPGTEQEVLSLTELIDLFDLSRVGKSGARFDPDKAKWFNHHYLQQKSDAELAEFLQPIVVEAGFTADIKLLTAVCGLMKERANFVSDIFKQGQFFFSAPTEYDQKVVKKRWKEGNGELITAIAKQLDACDDFTAPVLEEKVKAYIFDNELNMGQIMNCLRLSLVGSGSGPSLFDIMELVGKAETLKRIENAVKHINK